MRGEGYGKLGWPRKHTNPQKTRGAKLHPLFWSREHSDWSARSTACPSPDYNRWGALIEIVLCTFLCIPIYYKYIMYGQPPSRDIENVLYYHNETVVTRLYFCKQHTVQHTGQYCNKKKCLIIYKALNVNDPFSSFLFLSIKVNDKCEQLATPRVSYPLVSRNFTL